MSYSLLLHVAHQDPLSMEFSRQEYWSGYHFLLQGISLTWGLNKGVLHFRQIPYHVGYKPLTMSDRRYVGGGDGGGVCACLISSASNAGLARK